MQALLFAEIAQEPAFLGLVHENQENVASTSQLGNAILDSREWTMGIPLPFDLKTCHPGQCPESGKKFKVSDLKLKMISLFIQKLSPWA